MKLMNYLKYPLINLSVVYESDKPTEIPVDVPFGGL